MTEDREETEKEAQRQKPLLMKASTGVPVFQIGVGGGHAFVNRCLTFWQSPKTVSGLGNAIAKLRR